MIWKVVVAIGLILVLGGCSSTKTTATGTAPTGKTSGTLDVSLSFDPAPPAQGSETLTVLLKDTSGNAVRGAKVKISTHMPAMSMTGPTLVPQDNGDGTYSAVTRLNYATHWIFDISASRGADRGTAEFAADVK